MNKVAYGLHNCLAVIQQQPFHVQEVCLLEARNDRRIRQIQTEALTRNVTHRLVTKKELERLCGNVNHQGVAIIYKGQQISNAVDLLDYCACAGHPLLLLVMDQIVDPHNVGACLRTAEAAGADAVICSGRNSATLTPAARKVSCGAAERMPFIIAGNLARYLKELKELGVWVYGTQPKAKKSLYEANFCRSVALVVGSEATGIRRLTATTCDELLHLPMCGNMSSLNVSVAAGIGLFEIVRQRQAN